MGFNLPDKRRDTVDLATSASNATCSAVSFRFFSIFLMFLTTRAEAFSMPKEYIFQLY